MHHLPSQPRYLRVLEISGVEYYGVLQASYLLQDSITALYRLFLGSELNFDDKPNWTKLRDLRNDTVGHPVGRKKFVNRNLIAYDNVNYVWYPSENKLPKSEDFKLGMLLDGFASEATMVLDHILVRHIHKCNT